MGAHKTGPYDQIILFGDSITEQSADQARGFAYMPALQNAYLRRCDVMNRGFSGYNTSNGLRTLPLFMPKRDQAHVSLLVVFFGANDACLPTSSTKQHVPLARFKQNLRDIVTHDMVRVHRPAILLITAPPVNEYTMEAIDLLQSGSHEATRTAEHTRIYAEACKEVGLETKEAVLDLWSAIMKRAGWQPGDEILPGSKAAPENVLLATLLRDGLHFSPEGYKVLYEEVMKKITTTWPELSPQVIQDRFPAWADAPV